MMAQGTLRGAMVPHAGLNISASALERRTQPLRRRHGAERNVLPKAENSRIAPIGASGSARGAVHRPSGRGLRARRRSLSCGRLGLSFVPQDEMVRARMCQVYAGQAIETYEPVTRRIRPTDIRPA